MTSLINCQLHKLHDYNHVIDKVVDAFPDDINSQIER